MTSNDLLNKSNLSNSVNFLELPMEKIEQYIALLADFQQKSETEGKFVEAEIAKQRIIQLKNVQDKKRFKETQQRHIEEKEQLENSQKEELNEFNTEMDKQFYELSSKFQEMQNKLEETHEQELQQFQEEFEEKYKNSLAKPSSELINANKRLELFVKKKDYPNAHKTQVEIAELTKKEQGQHEKDKIKKFEREVENLRQRQQNETKALELRIQNNYNKFKRDRALAVESLLLKYKNKFREMDNNHKQEIQQFQKIIKEHSKGINGNPGLKQKMERKRISTKK